MVLKTIFGGCSSEYVEANIPNVAFLLIGIDRERRFVVS